MTTKGVIQKIQRQGSLGPSFDTAKGGMGMQNSPGAAEALVFEEHLEEAVMNEKHYALAHVRWLWPPSVENPCLLLAVVVGLQYCRR